MKFAECLCVVLCSLSLVSCIPVVRTDPDMPESTDIDTTDGQMHYFMQYGYMGKSSPDPRVAELSLQEQFANSIREFQRFAGLPVTGVMDEATKEKMKQPRCGLPDKVNMGDIARRKKRYALEGSRWSSRSLSYSILKYSSKLKRDQVDTEIDNAFKLWSGVTPLQFTKRASTPVDIEVEFGARSHGDGIPFDGPGNTLAHAFFPRYGGDLHLDEEERWVTDHSYGINLHQVAAHEIGHSLGLSHSDVSGALMQPFYSYNSNFMLHSDDIKGIQALYGANQATTTTTRRPTTTTPRATTTTPSRPASTSTATYPVTSTTTRRPTTRTTPQTLPTTTNHAGDLPHYCIDGRMDAITMTEGGNTYAFRGSEYFQLTTTGISPGFPRQIAGDWGSMTGPLDAAVFLDAEYDFQWRIRLNNGRYYFYRDWAATRSAVTWFFKGSECWKYEDDNLTGPLSISTEFPGLPNDLSAAFVWSGNGKLYFIKGDQYYRADSKTLRVDAGYPRPSSLWGSNGRQIDAALQWINKRTYFFTGQEYYRIDDRSLTMCETYPRPLGQWWFDCPAKVGNLQGGLMEELAEEGEFSDVTSSMTSLREEHDSTTAGGSGDSSSGATMTSYSVMVCLMALAWCKFFM